jgi:hypothetical protein
MKWGPCPHCGDSELFRSVELNSGSPADLRSSFPTKRVPRICEIPCGGLSRVGLTRFFAGRMRPTNSSHSGTGRGFRSSTSSNTQTADVLRGHHTCPLATRTARCPIRDRSDPRSHSSLDRSTATESSSRESTRPAPVRVAAATRRAGFDGGDDLVRHRTMRVTLPCPDSTSRPPWPATRNRAGRRVVATTVLVDGMRCTVSTGRTRAPCW